MTHELNFRLESSSINSEILYYLKLYYSFVAHVKGGNVNEQLFSQHSTGGGNEYSNSIFLLHDFVDHVLTNVDTNSFTDFYADYSDPKFIPIEFDISEYTSKMIQLMYENQDTLKAGNFTRFVFISSNNISPDEIINTNFYDVEGIANIYSKLSKAGFTFSETDKERLGGILREDATLLVLVEIMRTRAIKMYKQEVIYDALHRTTLAKYWKRKIFNWMQPKKFEAPSETILQDDLDLNYDKFINQKTDSLEEVDAQLNKSLSQLYSTTLLFFNKLFAEYSPEDLLDILKS